MVAAAAWFSLERILTMFSELLLFAAAIAAVLLVCSLLLARELRRILDVIDEERTDER